VSGTGLSVTNADGVAGNPTVTSNATAANTVSTIVARDASGNFSAGTITAALAGNAATATKLATARTVSLTGDVTGSVSFDGSANASITATVVDDSHNHIIANVDGLQTALDGKVAKDSNTGSAALPAGTTAQRSTVPVAGALRFNSTLTQFEGYDGTAWDAISKPDASLVGFQQEGAGAVVRTAQDKMREVVSVKDFGAVGDGVTDDTAAIQAADDYAYSVGAELHFDSGATYSVSELFIKSTRVFGHGAKLLKSSTTSQGFLNWGQKPSTMENGLLSDLIIDGGSSDNVTNLRIYGNHEKPKIRNVTLLNSDFYAVAVGGLSGHGDKSDIVNGLDIDGLRIESTRGNTALVTDYSFGLELFPGVTCNDWKIRNVHTVGKILNKIHSVDGLDIDFCTFEVPVEFNPQSSGYFEINNCDNLSLGKNNKSVYTSDMYYSLLIGNTRVVGGLGVNNARVSGEWGRVAFAGADSIYTDSAFKCRRLDLYNTVTKATLRGTLGAIYGIAGGALTRCDVIAAEVGAIYFVDATFTLGTIVFNGITQTRDTAYLLPIRFLCTGNIAFSNCALDAGMHNEAYGFQYNQAGGKVQLTNCRISGGGTTDRYFLFSNSPNTSAVGCNFENMNAATLYASGSQTLTTSRYNVLNGTAL